MTLRRPRRGALPGPPGTRGACRFWPSLAIVYAVAAVAPSGCARHGGREQPRTAPERAPTQPALPPAPRIVLPRFESPSPGPGRTPRETYEAAKACVARGDYLGAWELFSERARGEADGALPPALGEWRYFNPDGFRAEFGMTPSEFEKRPIAEQYALLSLHAHRSRPEAPERFASSEFVSESIEGDSAEVTYRTGDGAESKMRLVREGGLWKLARPRF